MAWFCSAVDTYSYARMLYKYPQAEFPYRWLTEENGRRSREETEFEILDTGIFDDDRYFDVEIEYAKAAHDDIFMRLTVSNRSADPAEIWVLPQVWLRNTWSWSASIERPFLSASGNAVHVTEPSLGPHVVEFEAPDEIAFCENETNAPRLFGSPGTGGPYKDGIDDYVVGGDRSAVRIDRGTKAAAVFRRSIAGGGSVTIPCALHAGRAPESPFPSTTSMLSSRSARRRPRHFTRRFSRDRRSPSIARSRGKLSRACSGQSNTFTTTWKLGFGATTAGPVAGRGALVRAQPPLAECLYGRRDLCARQMGISLVRCLGLGLPPDALALVDLEDAKRQLVLLCQSRFMHPNGQLPAYEWDFDDVNPPVQAWAALQLYETEKRQRGKGDRRFLERVFTKLLLNFTWWVNREDHRGNNIFQGGFLGMDNIGVFDRSKPFPAGGLLMQSDGTSWMAMYSINMLRIAVELAQEDAAYQDIATKFFEHFLAIGGAMTNLGGEGIGLWDDEDDFFYDWLVTDSGGRTPLRIRSLVGLVPLFAIEVIEADVLERLPEFFERREWFLHHRPQLSALVSSWNRPGANNTRLIAMTRGFRTSKLLERVVDETEFLSAFGVRSLSRFHLEAPFEFQTGAISAEVRYLPAESDSGLFGGNSNWRGPIWMPINYMLIKSIEKFGAYFGDEFCLEFPTGSGRLLSLKEIADELRRRLISIFVPDQEGRRPVFGDRAKLAARSLFQGPSLVS